MTYADQLDTDIITFLKRHENKELLRFVSVGSVDDGKSTLIGRLLQDSGSVYEDHLVDARGGTDGPVDLARITDGLKAEREQGITIDVAYRYFTTAKRKFIIADTPGHIQYTRNMATGASTANVAIILIDARLGVLQQSRRHAYIASLLGIPHLLVAVNKMDLVDFDQARFDEICADFRNFARGLRFHDVTFVPISALLGDNVVEASDKTDWYEGDTVLGYLENVDIVSDRNLDQFRFPVQYVLRPHLDYRGFAGQIASGRVSVGDEVVVVPGNTRSRVKAIDTYDGELESAHTPLGVVLRLEDEIDISRGDMIVPVDNRPRVGRTFRAMMVWMAERGLDTGKSYLIKHGTRYLRADMSRVEYRVDLNTMEHAPAGSLGLNDIGCVTVTCHREIAYDPYPVNRGTGAFIVIDSMTNNTVAAGMIMHDEAAGDIDLTAQPHSGVSLRERAERLGHRGGVVWMTGLPAAGKSTLAYAVERRLFDLGCVPAVVDPDDGGDDLYETSDAIHEAVAEIRRLVDAGLLVVCAFTSGQASDRASVAAHFGEDHFLEVHVSTSAEVCRQRDARGLWADPAGLSRPIPGINAEYDAPESAAVTVDLAELDVERAVGAVVRTLRERGWLLDA